MGSLLQIRNVPDDVRRTLKARAAARGQSLNAYLLDLVDREVERPTVDEVLERSARRSRRLRESSFDVVQAGRDERDLELRRETRG